MGWDAVKSNQPELIYNFSMALLLREIYKIHKYMNTFLVGYGIKSIVLQ